MRILVAAGGSAFDRVIDVAAKPNALGGTAAGSGVTTTQPDDYNPIGTFRLFEAGGEWNAEVILLSTSLIYSISALAAEAAHPFGMALFLNRFGVLDGASQFGHAAQGCPEGRFGPHAVGSSAAERPYDLPRAVLDHSLASTGFGWHPARGPESIFNEIAAHAVKHPDWLDHCGR